MCCLWTPPCRVLPVGARRSRVRAAGRPNEMRAAVDPLFGFTTSSYMSRGKSRLDSCNGILDRAAPAIRPPRAAVSGESAAGLPLTDVPDRPP
jgi:hypothetical protein